MFCLDRLCGRELAPGNALRPLYDLKFPRGQTSVKIGANLGVRNLPHTATEAVADQRPLIYDRLAFEILVAGKGKGFSNPVQRVEGLLLMLRLFTCCTDNGVGLVPKRSCQLPVCGHYLRRRMDLFPVASRVCRDLGSFFSGAASLGVANRDLAVIESIRPDGRVTAGLTDNRQIEFNAREHPHFDHGYAVTSHSSQGLTAERVLVHADTSVHPDLLNSRFAYVSVSRTSHDAVLFTDDVAKLGPQLAADVSKTSALEISQASSSTQGIGLGL